MKKIMTCDLLIIGAGLSGLAAAYYLKDKNTKVILAESRDRLGGRIHTLQPNDDQPIEMGATWIGIRHEYLTKLLSDLEIGVFDQVIGKKAIYEAISTSPHYLATLPDNPEPSLRIQGGSNALIKKLAQQVGHEQILLSEQITSITEKENYLEVTGNKFSYQAKKVISTLPPNLLTNTIQFTPALPEALTDLSKQTHTWMGNSIKIALSFAKPFWRTQNVAGTIISNVGPIPEMYDHSNYEDTQFSLMGFLNGSYHSVSKADRLHMILSQLRKYFGDVVDSYTDYHELVWIHEKATYIAHEREVIPHQNNGHSLFQQSYLNDKFMLSGTETSTQFPGYMEGAVYRGMQTAEWAAPK